MDLAAFEGAGRAKGVRLAGQFDLAGHPPGRAGVEVSGVLDVQRKSDIGIGTVPAPGSDAAGPGSQIQFPLETFQPRQPDVALTVQIASTQPAAQAGQPDLGEGTVRGQPALGGQIEGHAAGPGRVHLARVETPAPDFQVPGRFRRPADAAGGLEDTLQGLGPEGFDVESLQIAAACHLPPPFWNIAAHPGVQLGLVVAGPAVHAQPSRRAVHDPAVRQRHLHVRPVPCQVHHRCLSTEGDGAPRVQARAVPAAELQGFQHQAVRVPAHGQALDAHALVGRGQPAGQVNAGQVAGDGQAPGQGPGQVRQSHRARGHPVHGQRQVERRIRGQARNPAFEPGSHRRPACQGYRQVVECTL